MIAAFISLSILGLLTLFQIALIAGAPLGRFAWGGAHTILSPKLRIASVFSIIIYALIAMLIASKVSLISIIPQGTFLTVSLWVVIGYFILGIGMNAISRSKAERYTMTPTVLLLAVCVFFVAKI